MTKPTETPVIFRKFKNGEVIALFPTLAPGGRGSMQSYMHVGQHGDASYHRLTQYPSPPTKLATPEEYAPLLAELKRIGYEGLKVYRKNQTRFDRARQAAN